MRENARQQPLSRHVDRDSGRIASNPTSSQLFGAGRRCASATRRIKDQVSRISRHKEATFNDLGGGRVAQPFGFRPHGSERAAFPHSAPPEGYPTRAKETSRG